MIKIIHAEAKLRGAAFEVLARSINGEWFRHAGHAGNKGLFPVVAATRLAIKVSETGEIDARFWYPIRQCTRLEREYQSEIAYAAENELHDEYDPDAAYERHLEDAGWMEALREREWETFGRW